VNRPRTRIGSVAAIAAVAVCATQPLVAPPVRAETFTYKYVIGTIRLIGLNEASIERQALRQLIAENHLEGLEVVATDRDTACDVPNCDVVTVQETDEHSFKVNFFAKQAALADPNHREQVTQRLPFPDNERLIWREGSKAIAKLVAKHYEVHNPPRTSP
jgi:hypothetical protein